LGRRARPNGSRRRRQRRSPKGSNESGIMSWVRLHPDLLDPGQWRARNGRERQIGVLEMRTGRIDMVGQKCCSRRRCGRSPAPA
jgi:hypothetical protein